jgi:hypothetical protein
MKKIERLKKIWAEVYDPKNDAAAVINEFFHKDYKQCINGVILTRPEYVNHVIAQKQNVVINHIEYVHHLEKDDELFAIYCPCGKSQDGTNIEAEVVCYFQFHNNQILNIHGQVRLLKGEFANVDM